MSFFVEWQKIFIRRWVFIETRRHKKPKVNIYFLVFLNTKHDQFSYVYNYNNTKLLV